MNPYKILSITEQASDEEVRRAYLAMAAKYHPDVGGDAWVFEQVRDAYDRIQKSRRRAAQAAASSVPPRDQNATQPTPQAAAQKASTSGPPHASTASANPGSHSSYTPHATGQRPAASAKALDATEESDRSDTAVKSLLQRVVNILFRHQLPLQSETNFFILANVLDIVFTNILLRMDAIEANPIANYFLIHWGFHGMIAFKLFLVACVCLITQLIAVHHLLRARQTLYFGTLIVSVVVVYSGLLLMRT